MIKEEIAEYFREIRNSIVEEHHEGIIADAELIEKLTLVKEMEREATEIVVTVKKLISRRSE